MTNYNKNSLSIKKKSIYFASLLLLMIEEIIFNSLNWNTNVAKLFYGLATFSRIASLVLILIYISVEFKGSQIKWILICTISALVTFLSFRTTSFYQLIFFSLILTGCFNINFIELLKVYYKGMSVCFILMLLALVTGLSVNEKFVFDYGTGYDLGSGHPNELACYIMNFVFLTCYLYIRKKWKMAIFSFISGLLVYRITVSRATYILMLSFSTLVLIYFLLEKVHAAWAINILRIISVAVVVASVSLMLSGASNSYGLDNSLFQRFNQAYIILNKYGIHLFGSDIEFISTAEAMQKGLRSATILDNGYLRLLLYNGVLCFILFVIGIVVLLVKTGKNRDYLLLIIAFLMLLDGLAQKSVYNPFQNFSLFAIISIYRMKPTVNQNVMQGRK